MSTSWVLELQVFSFQGAADPIQGSLCVVLCSIPPTEPQPTAPRVKNTVPTNFSCVTLRCYSFRIKLTWEQQRPSRRTCCACVRPSPDSSLDAFICQAPPPHLHIMRPTSVYPLYTYFLLSWTTACTTTALYLSWIYLPVIIWLARLWHGFILESSENFKIVFSKCLFYNPHTHTISASYYYDFN